MTDGSGRTDSGGGGLSHLRDTLGNLYPKFPAVRNWPSASFSSLRSVVWLASSVLCRAQIRRHHIANLGRAHRGLFNSKQPRHPSGPEGAPVACRSGIALVNIQKYCAAMMINAGTTTGLAVASSGRWHRRTIRVPKRTPRAVASPHRPLDTPQHKQLAANQLDMLRNVTMVVADTGELDEIKRYTPQDCTTNPTLVLRALSSPSLQHLVAGHGRTPNELRYAHKVETSTNQHTVVDSGRMPMPPTAW